MPAVAPAALRTAYEILLNNSAVQKALTALRDDDARAFEEQKTLTRIPAPPFHEKRRASYLLERFQTLGLGNARIDAEGNVVGIRPGLGKGPRLVLCAHLDTVFSEETDLTITERNGKIFAPGIGDDARGVATLLSVLKIMKDENITTAGDVIFLGSVGEEELGDLRGVKAFFQETPDIDGFLAIDGTDLSRVVYAGTGSRRYEIVFYGPGGHSFNAFGTASAVHALGRSIAKIADLVPPAQPKTTFTVGTIHGGTSINAIAGEARMGVDMRSNDMTELEHLEKQVLALVNEAIADENHRWQTNTIRVDLRRVGDRPAGALPTDSTIVHCARRTLQAVGCETITLASASTDANIPISLGIPSLAIGVGGEGGGAHSLNEWYRNKDAYLAAQNALLLILGLTGLHGTTVPLLEKRNAAR